MGVMSRIERSYENCEMYDNLQDHWRSERYMFKGCREGLIDSCKNCEYYKIYENCDFYDKL